MKKFRFRLERILQIKAHLEKEKQKVHGMAARKVADQETYLHDLNKSREKTQEEQLSFLSGKVNPNHLVNYSRYYLKLKKQELTGREILKAYIIDREKRRLELVEATKQKKIYEKLREHRVESFNKEFDLHTQKEQDELAGKMHINKKSSRI